MKIFDYKLAKEIGHSDAVLNFFKEYQDKKIGVDFFIIAMKKFPKKVGSRVRQPYQLKRQYKNLKEMFGFFGG